MVELMDTLSVMILLTAFVLMASKRFKSYIRAFRLQSILIALTVGIMGAREYLDEGRVDVLFVCLLIVTLKVVLIPRLMNRTYAGIEKRVEKDFIWNIPMLVLVSSGLVVFSYFAVSDLEGMREGAGIMQMVNAVSLILIGLFFMISRKKAIGQIIGFLVIENGLFTTAVMTTHGMPLIVDLGIFVDLITAVLIMGVMVFRISERFESINLDKLNKLKG